MNAPNPLLDTVRWLSANARFPASRLAPRSEVLLCIAALAAADEAEQRQRYLIQSRDPAQTSAQRTHGLRRAQVHFKCDNSAKV
ncbi:MAG: hypothetical protein JWM35_268 [Verrucomicrobia bacterium]|nr:hypothetical protein [Verrucomicrobiota bacterium]